MKLHRDAPAELAPPPRFTEIKVSLREDLLRVGVVMLALFGGGVFVTLTLTLFTELWQALGMSPWRGLAVGAWASAGLSMLPLAAVVWVFLREFGGRHSLTMTRLSAEQQSLVTSWLDLDGDATVEDDELQRFLDYVRHLHRPGAKTTAAEAQRLFGVSGPQWQMYRKALVTLGYAYEDAKRGGKGFELRPSVRMRPWSEIERDLTQRAGLLVRAQDNPGLLITTTPAPTKRAPISTLPGDTHDLANVD